MDSYEEWLGMELVFGNTVMNMVMFFGALVATIVVAKLVQGLFRNQLRRLAERSATMLDDILLDTFQRPLYWVILVSGVQLSFHTLVLSERVTELVNHTTMVILILFVTWTLSNLISALRAHYVDPRVEASDSKFDDQVVPIIEKALKVFLWVLAGMIMISNMGYDILSLLTGLGIGGLAIAMAAQDTLSNVFGSVTIFADQPFQINDLITVSGHTGIVTEVGLRTSRLLTPAGTTITIPNSAMVAGTVINHSGTGLRRKEMIIGLVYDTTADELQRAMAGALQIIEAHQETDDCSTTFVNFADCALEIAIRFGVKEAADYGGVCSEINLQIKERFDREGWGMAFPTMTLDGLSGLARVA
jgi:MscS family membrane protein